MHTITRVAAAMQTLLTETADQVARDTGFVRRCRKLRGSGFAQALTLGWMSHPHHSWEQIAATAGAAGQAVSVQGLHQRCGERSAAFLQALLAEATRRAITAPPQTAGRLARFPHVWVQDSTTLMLPAALQAIWPGCGNGDQGGEAALKLHLRLDLVSGWLVGPLPLAARVSDKSCVLHQDVPPAGSLLLADMGYFQISRLAQLDRAGVYWISGCQPQTAFFTADGQRLGLLKWLGQQGQDEVEAAVQIGVAEHLTCRLIARRNAPEKVGRLRRGVCKDAKRRGRSPSAAALAWCDWTVVVTNLPAEKACAAEVLILKATRWQVELLFKLWKSHAEIDQAHSDDPWIVLTELFAKLLAVVVGHWMLLTTSWRPVTRSLTKAWRTLRGYAAGMVGALFRGVGLADVLGDLGRALERTACIFRSQKQPRTHQQLRFAA